MQSYIRSQVLDEMRNPNIYYDTLKYVENHIDDAFHKACRKNLSVNDILPDSRFGNGNNQKTVYLTVQLSFVWEDAIIYSLNNHLKNAKSYAANDAEGDLIVVYNNGYEEKWEIKTSQNLNQFTGATHSASKCDNYILINYGMDKDMKLKTNYYNMGFIKELSVFVWPDMDINWVGEPTNNSSWTVLKFSNKCEENKEIQVIGKLEKSKKWCKIKRDNLMERIH